MKILGLGRARFVLLFIKVAVVAKVFAERHVEIKTGHMSHEEKFLQKNRLSRDNRTLL
jgi:hypothetical protein